MHMTLPVTRESAKIKTLQNIKYQHLIFVYAYTIGIVTKAEEGFGVVFSPFRVATSLDFTRKIQIYT
jgi:hypothetical protein